MSAVNVPAPAAVAYKRWFGLVSIIVADCLATAEEQHIRGTQGFGVSNSRALNGVGPDNAEHGVRAFGPGLKSKTHDGFYRPYAWRCDATTCDGEH